MRKLLKTGAAVAALCGAFGAYALTDSTNLGVSLTITSACDVTTTAPAPVAFGTHAQNATVPVDTAGSVTVTCVGAVPYNVLLGQGNNHSGSRRMTDGTNFVPYELYRDAGRTQVWGETIGTDTVGDTGTQTIQVHGRVPSLAFPAGTYSDTVLVTVDY